MVTKKEKCFLGTLLALWIILGVSSIVFAVICIIDIFNNDTMNDNIFELIYMAVHLIVIGFFIMLTINSFKKGSYFLRNISYSSYEGVSIPVRVVSIIGFVLGAALVVLGILYLSPLDIHDFNFPITTKYSMIDAGLLFIVLWGAFFMFPFIFAKNPTLSKKEETERNERRKQR